MSSLKYPAILHQGKRRLMTSTVTYDHSPPMLPSVFLININNGLDAHFALFFQVKQINYLCSEGTQLKRRDCLLSKQGCSAMTKLIKDIKKFTVGISIRARVALEWRPRGFDSLDYDGLHYLLVDEEGSSIHAMIEECYHGYMPKLMKLGQVYDISWFGSKIDTARQKVCNADIILTFTAKTLFSEVGQDMPNIPRYAFKFVEFSQLGDQAESQSVLADFCGCIKAIKEPQQVGVKNSKKREIRTDLIFMFEGREELKIALWGDIARSFPIEEVRTYNEPVLAVFTSMRITKYEGRLSASSTNHTCMLLNPDIEQTKKLKNQFSRVADKIRVSGAYTTLTFTGEINKADRKSIAELKALDPAIHATKSVWCRAVVARFFAEKGWWYNSCSHDKCYKVMLKNEEGEDKYFCLVHGENKPKKSYRVFMIIEDEHDQVNLTLMGRSAEEFFNATCQDLLDKRFYETEATLPIEISSKVGETFLFDINMNNRGQFFLRSTVEDDNSKKRSLTDEDPATEIENEEPSSETPAKASVVKKRGNKAVAKKLFIDEMNKKGNRDEDVDTSMA